jgi:tetratricopeptide (TPR) repeat protein
MSHPYFNSVRSRLLFSAALLLSSTLPVIAQTPAARPGVIKEAVSPKGEAYYHYALGHLYEEMAGAYGNRSEYVNKAIDNYRLAMKDDPAASFLVEDIAELYHMSGRIREAVEEAQAALKTNPDDVNARRVLAHIYTQQIGDAQTNHVDEGMAKRAIEQYKLITEKDPKDVESLIMLGRLQKVLGNSVDAEASYKKVLAADPGNEDAVTGLAGIYSDRGDPKTASDLLEKLNKKTPSTRSLVALANDYEQMRQFSLAADTYQRALELDPGRIELKAPLAQNQSLAGRFDEALKTYQELAAANPQDAEPYLGMSQVYREQKKFADAREMLDKAKSLDPDNLDIRYNEVLLLQEQGKTPDAIAALKSILDSTAKRNYTNADRATRADMLDRLGSLYRANQQYDQAVDCFRQVYNLNPDLGARSEAQVIETYRVAKDYPKAQQESDAAAKKYPTDRMLTEVRAQVLSDEGKTDAAIAELKKLLDGKNDREIYLAMAERYQEAKNFTEMGKVLDQAEQLAPDKDDQTTIAFMRGSMYEREKKYDLAEKAFRKVLDADPTNASALNYLGYMLADQGSRLQEAQDLIKRAVSLDPNNYAFLDSLGWVYYRQNKLDDAEQQLRHSLQIMSADPTIHDHLGDVLFKEGKLKDAIDQWQSSLKEWSASAPAEVEPEEVAKVQKKLDGARVRLAKLGR